MPTRTTRPRVAAHPVITTSPYVKRAVAHHASQIIILWVVIICLTLGIFLTGVSYVTRVSDTEYAVRILNARLQAMEVKMQQLAVDRVMPTLPTATPTPTAPATALGGVAATSPSGALTRGSFSPDGTKYAGYNDTIAGRIGMAVEIIETKKVRYIEILNTRVESTGAGTDAASAMSVRWVDNSTIEFDVLVTKNGEQVKETRTSRIYF